MFGFKTFTTDLVMVMSILGQKYGKEPYNKRKLDLDGKWVRWFFGVPS